MTVDMAMVFYVGRKINTYLNFFKLKLIKYNTYTNLNSNSWPNMYYNECNLLKYW